MAKHNELVEADLHVPGYVQSGDPGAVGAGVGWIDTSGGAGNWLWKIRNATDNGWEILVSAGGVTDFVDLDDTPAGYGAEGQVLTTNGVDTLSWGDVPEPSGVPVYELVDEQLDIVCYYGLMVNVTYSKETFTDYLIDDTPDGATLDFGSDVAGTPLYINTEVGSLAITATVSGSPVVITDPAGDGNLVGSNVSGTVDYATGDWHLTFTGTAPTDTTDITADYDAYTFTTPKARLSAYDCIRAIHGGVGPLEYGIEKGVYSGTVTTELNPRDVYIEFECGDLGQVPIYVWVVDGYGNTYGPIEMFVIVSDVNGLCGGGGP